MPAPMWWLGPGMVRHIGVWRHRRRCRERQIKSKSRCRRHAAKPPPIRGAKQISTTEITEPTEREPRKFRDLTYRRLSLNEFLRLFFAAPSTRHFQFLRALGDLRGETFLGTATAAGQGEDSGAVRTIDVISGRCAA